MSSENRIEISDNNSLDSSDSEISLVLPASYAQQRLWFLAQLEPNNPYYNICYAFKMRGALEVDALEKSINDIASRHESLRTKFAIKNGQPVQVINHACYIPLNIIDLSTNHKSTVSGLTDNLIKEEARLVFKLDRDMLIRAKLIKLDINEHIFMLTMHHIISDYTSWGIFLSELEKFYCFNTGIAKQVEVPTLEIQYADYSEWQRQWLESSEAQLQTNYWQQQLANELVSNIPTSYPRPSVQNYQGAVTSFAIEEKLGETT